MGFAVRVRSAGQKYGPTCHQRDRADVTGFVTLVRLPSLGQHVGVLALAGYKRRKSALTAGPIKLKNTENYYKKKKQTLDVYTNDETEHEAVSFKFPFSSHEVYMSIVHKRPLERNKS